MGLSLRILITIAHMNGKTSIDVGIAGSLTMIVLVTAVTLLLVSFYRRFKKLSDRNEDK